MSDAFLQLPSQEQSQALFQLASPLGRSPFILEKDIWICWVLEQLFSIPDSSFMAFKGGTSLSKVFNVIHRFSEDVDVTLDYRYLDNSLNPFDENISKTQLKKLSDKLKLCLKIKVHDIVVPYLRRKLQEQFDNKMVGIKASEDGEKLYIYYPSVTNDTNDYLTNNILVEFGGRNTTEPNEKHAIIPDIAKSLPDLLFPTAKVNVLSPIRTFWEKATLMHVACHKEWKDGYERQSRHWYDLAMLAENSIGQEALLNRTILDDVIKHKSVFYNSPHANYDKCNRGQLKLIPTNTSTLGKLELDFKNMVDSDMFYAEQPSFDKIIKRLKKLEQEINNQ